MKKAILSAIVMLFTVVISNQKVRAQDQDSVYNFMALEHVPTYPGGIEKFYELLSKNVKYPKVAMENNIQGVVRLSFVVEKDGTLTDIIALTDLGGGLEEEAIRVMSLSKKWSPGMLVNKPVRVKYNIPIKFSLGRRKGTY